MSTASSVRIRKSWGLRGTDVVGRTVVFARLIVAHVKRTWLVYVLLACCYQLALPNYRLARNGTKSIDANWFVVHLNAPVVRGGFIAFRHDTNGVYPVGMWWLKRVVGLEGDRVTRDGLRYAVNGVFFGEAKLVGLSGRLLHPVEIPAEGMTIGKNQWFVLGDHPFSFDSRYSEIGLVDRDQLIGRAYVVY